MAGIGEEDGVEVVVEGFDDEWRAEFLLESQEVSLVGPRQMRRSSSGAG